MFYLSDHDLTQIDMRMNAKGESSIRITNGYYRIDKNSLNTSVEEMVAKLVRKQLTGM